MTRKEFEQLHIKNGELVTFTSKTSGVHTLIFAQVSESGNHAIFNKMSIPFTVMNYTGKNFIGWHCFNTV